ncbi:MAG: 1,4-dihydroxy-2-naphthoate octaprenyltransferase, partial [Opitutales bacterium]
MSLGAWLGATRPLTLVASMVPVVVGTIYSWRQTAEISWTIFALCLGFAFLMQIGANFANDYYDFGRGADRHDRIGPARAVASGMIRPGLMKAAAYVVLALGFALGLALLRISNGGWPLLAVGVASVVCALAYTSGPWPLAYLGLGDLFVILFFGLVAV